MKARVLFIDDDPGVSEVISLLLEREGYTVQCAGTVKQAVTLVESRSIDLVVTDLKLPDGTGLDIIHAIRNRKPALPIIMITSYSSVESAVAALRGGAADYVIKPFDNNDFLRAVARALKDRRRAALPGEPPLPIEAYIREVVERFQDTHSEIELARMLGIGRKALWMRRRQWGLKRNRRNVT
ncbi:MAG TPA: response regulator [Burkholderiales bacterium]|nr:response regulator [Burkholderiales bacterium]